MEIYHHIFLNFYKSPFNLFEHTYNAFHCLSFTRTQVNINGVAGTLKKIHASKGDYCNISCVPFSKWELLLKKRICSQREQILSFKSSSLWYVKSLTTLGDLPRMCTFLNTHVRNCVMGATPMNMTRKCLNHISQTNLWHHEEETLKHRQINTKQTIKQSIPQPGPNVIILVSCSTQLS